MERKQSHSSQHSKASFQPHSVQQRSPLENTTLKPPPLHSSSNPHPSLNPERPQAHTVHKGDTLWDIAQHQWGDGNRWHELQKPNGSHFTEQEARKLQVGSSVYIPAQKATSAFQVKSYTDGFGGKPHEVTHQGSSDRGINFQKVTSDQPMKQVAMPSRIRTKDVSSQAKSAVKLHHDASSQPERSQVSTSSSAYKVVHDKSHSTQKGYASPAMVSENHSSYPSDAAKGAAAAGAIVYRKLTSQVPTESSRAARPLVYSVTDEKGKPLIQPVRVKRVRASQGDISGKLTNKTPVSSVVESMKKHGWDFTAQPPDMVKFNGRKLSLGKIKIPISRGHITTLDHRRIAAAKEAGLTKIPARVHSEHDLIKPDVPSRLGSAGRDVANRFKLRRGEFPAPKTGSIHTPGYKPQNWGETVRIRSAEQIARGHSNFPPTGSKHFPTIPHESSGIAKVSAEALQGSVTKGIAKGVVRGASRAAVPLGIALDGYDLTKTYQQDGVGSKFRSKAAGVAGGWGGAALGAEGGAAIGTAIFPGVGTVVGGLIGGAGGYLVGSGAASKLEEGIESVAPKAWDGAKSVGSGIADGAKSAWHSINPFD